MTVPPQPGSAPEGGIAAAVVLAAVVLGGTIIVTWLQRGFGQLSDERLAVVAAALFIIGVQIFFSSFLLSILGLRSTRTGGPPGA